MSIRKRGFRNFCRVSRAVDPDVQRLVIDQLLVIVVPVGILWFVWIKMLDQ